MAKKIIITGASTGIGAETSRMLAPGNEIIVHYYSSKGPAEAVAADIEKAGGKAHLLQADLSKSDECERFVAECAKLFPVVDVLVNNAGGLIRRQPINELDWDFMIETFALNTFSTMKVTSLCVPLLEKAEDPVIINMTSIAMRHGAPLRHPLRSIQGSPGYLYPRGRHGAGTEEDTGKCGSSGSHRNPLPRKGLHPGEDEELQGEYAP